MALSEWREVALGLVLAGLFMMGGRLTLHQLRPHPSSSPMAGKSRRAMLVLMASGQASLLLVCLNIFTGREFLSSLDFVLRRVMQLLCPLLLVDASLAYLRVRQKPDASAGRCCGGDASTAAATDVKPGQVFKKDDPRKKGLLVDSLKSTLWSYLLMVAGVVVSISCLDLITCPFTLMMSAVVSSLRGRGNQSDRTAVPETNALNLSDSTAGANQFVSDTDGGVDIVNYVTVFPELVLYCAFYIPLMVYVLCQVWPLLTERTCQHAFCDTTDYPETSSCSLSGPDRYHVACSCAVTAFSGQTCQQPYFQDKAPPLEPKLVTAPSSKGVSAKGFQSDQRPSPPPTLWKGAESGKSRREEEDGDCVDAGDTEACEPSASCGTCAAMAPYVPVACLVALMQVGVLGPLWTTLTLSPGLPRQQQVTVLPSCVLFLPLYCAFCSVFWSAAV